MKSKISYFDCGIGDGCLLATMDCEEVKHIHIGKNQGRDVTNTQGIKTQPDVFWKRHSKRWPGEDVCVWNVKWQNL